MSQFAHNIKKLRQRKAKNQAQVADDLIINRSTYAAYEEGRGTPDFKRLIIMADYFSITIDELLRKEL